MRCSRSYGTVKYRLGYSRLSWVLFPLYLESTRKGTDTTYTPWPFVRVMRGERNGFAVWPLFGESKGPGPARQFYILWPFIWSNVTEPDPERPRRHRPRHGVRLPSLLHAREGPGDDQRELPLAVLRLHRAHASLPLQREAVLLAVLRAGPRRRPRGGPLGAPLHPLELEGIRFPVGRLAPLAPSDLGRRRHPPVKDPVLLLRLLVP